MAIPQVYIIAEIGVNHNGNITLAKQLIDAAKSVGADAVKFQSFSASKLVTSGTPKVAYQKGTTDSGETHFDMLKKLELSEESHHVLFRYCQSVGIEFVSTPYDVESVDFLADLGVNRFKTASADVVDLTLHERIAATGKNVLIATGMATFGEIEDALNCYPRGGRENITLLHCVSNYPCSDASLNLNVIPSLKTAFGCKIGYSDHSVGPVAATLVTGLGVSVIEKHFTLDKGLAGPDHKASSTPSEFRELINSVRRAELMLGSSVKMQQPEEAEMAKISRKSITLVRSIDAGTVIEAEYLRMMRPGLGLSAKFLPNLIGCRARTAMPAFHQIRWTDVDHAKD